MRCSCGKRIKFSVAVNAAANKTSFRCPKEKGGCGAVWTGADVEDAWGRADRIKLGPPPPPSVVVPVVGTSALLPPLRPNQGDPTKLGKGNGEMKHLDPQIRYLLATDDLCRNDDRWLHASICQEFWGIDIRKVTLEQWAKRLVKAPDYESVRRSRAKIQSPVFYPPTVTDALEARGYYNDETGTLRKKEKAAGKRGTSTSLHGPILRDLGYTVGAGVDTEED